MSFVGVDNHYFLAAALAGAEDASITYRSVPLPPRVPARTLRGWSAIRAWCAWVTPNCSVRDWRVM